MRLKGEQKDIAMERERLVEFVEQRYGRVVAALAVVCGDRERAEDAVQDALASAWMRDDVRDVHAWVTRVALNQVSSTWRRAGAERRATARLARYRLEPSSNEEPALDRDAVRTAVRMLPRREREAVVLHYLLDLSVEDVAMAMGVTSGTVKTSLHRARVALRGALHGYRRLDEEAKHVK